MLVVGGALFTVPAAILMERIGRRPGFMISSFAAALASLGGIAAIFHESFSLFCLTALLIGANMAFVQQYRFAAAEAVAPSEVGKAVSVVLLGGIAAAFLGPELAKISRELLPYGLYSGSFAVLSALYVVNGGLLYFLREPSPVRKRSGGQGTWRRSFRAAAPPPHRHPPGLAGRRKWPTPHSGYFCSRGCCA